MRTLAVLGLCCIFGVQADFIVDFFSNYSPCANGISVWREFFFFFYFYFLRHYFKPSLVALALPCYVLYCSKKKKKTRSALTNSLTLYPKKDCRPGEQCVSCGHSNISGELTGRPIGKYCSGPQDYIPLCKNHAVRGRVKTTAYADDFLMCLVATCAETRQNPSEWEQLTDLLRLRIWDEPSVFGAEFFFFFLKSGKFFQPRLGWVLGYR